MNCWKKKWKEVFVTQEININIYFCCGSEIWLFTMREEHRLRMSKSRTLKRILRTTGQELTGR
jgi:hypothetical protein